MQQGRDCQASKGLLALLQSVRSGPVEEENALTVMMGEEPNNRRVFGREVGVIVHGIDTFEDKQRPWAACSPHDPRCDFLSDRVSASVIYQGKVPRARERTHSSRA